MTDLQAWIKQRAEQDERLYECYGKPLEADHKGQYVAIGPEGDVILGHDDLDVTQQASARFGSGNYAFRRLGYTWEEKWRSHRSL